MRVAWVVVLLAGWAAAQSPTPWTGTRDGRNLECNSTADGAVLLNGNDVVSRTAWPVALSQNPRGTRVFYLVSGLKMGLAEIKKLGKSGVGERKEVSAII